MTEHQPVSSPLYNIQVLRGEAESAGAAYAGEEKV